MGEGLGTTILAQGPTPPSGLLDEDVQPSATPWGYAAAVLLAAMVVLGYLAARRRSGRRRGRPARSTASPPSPPAVPHHEPPVEPSPPEHPGPQPPAVPAAPEPSAAVSRTYSVVSGERGWLVREADVVVLRDRHRERAVRAAHDIAKQHQPSRVRVYGRDGHLEAERVYDPRTSP